MRGFGLWLFILSLPLLAVVGHDGYMVYHGKQALDLSKPLPFSDAGWIWQRRAYGSWRWAHDTVSPKIWQRFVKPVLDQKAVVVAAALPAGLLLITLLLRLFGMGPYAGRGLLFRRAMGGNWRNGREQSTIKQKPVYKRR